MKCLRSLSQKHYIVQRIRIRIDFDSNVIVTRFHSTFCMGHTICISLKLLMVAVVVVVVAGYCIADKVYNKSTYVHESRWMLSFHPSIQGKRAVECSGVCIFDVFNVLSLFLSQSLSLCVCMLFPCMMAFSSHKLMPIVKTSTLKTS